MQTKKLLQGVRRALMAGVVGVSLFAAGGVQAESLTVALSASVQTLKPWDGVVPGTDLSVISQLYSALITRGADLKLTGGVAESWELINPTTWKFVLKPGITFPNGEPLDAAAVAWNIEQVTNPDVNARSRSFYTVIDHAEVISPTEVHIITKQPFGALPEQVVMLFLMAPKWTAEHNATLEAMGTGPYDLVSYTPGEQIVLKAKTDYFGPKPDFDDVTIRLIPDAAARVAGLLAGELDAIADILPVDVATINASGKGKAGAIPSNKTLVMKFNMQKPPLDNLLVRQAINYAIDKQGIIDAVYEGTTVPSRCQTLSPGMLGFNPNLEPYPYDPDKARQLLAESGLPLPIKLELEVPIGRYLLAQDSAQVIAGELADVGIEANLVEMEFTAWMSKFWDAKDMGQLAMVTQYFATNDGGGTLNLFHKDFQINYWYDDEFSADLDAARSATDPAEAQKLFDIATQRMCDQAATGFLYTLPATYATSNRVDWQARPDDWVRPSEMRLAAQ